MLTLVGLGLWGERDITLRGLDAVKKADFIYLEGYTGELMGTAKEKMEQLYGKKVELASREDLEQRPEPILEKARKKNVVLLVGGDPMVATTHADLVLRVKERRIDFRIIHNASIYSAICESGLQIYRFGKTATVTFWEKNFKPTSFYDAVKENRTRNLHTLLLLDIKPGGGRKMTANEALETLLKIDGNLGKVVVMARLGGDDMLIKYGEAKGLVKQEFGHPMHCIVIPAPKLHAVEEEYLRWRG
jgi:diphthine synthase